MNKWSILLLLTLFGFNHPTNPTTIEIYSVGMDLKTHTRISCAGFMSAFEKGELKKRIIHGNKVKEILDQLKKLNLRRNNHETDTRAKLFVRFESHTDTLCADEFSIVYRRTFYSMPEELRKIIW